MIPRTTVLTGTDPMVEALQIRGFGIVGTTAFALPYN